MTSVLYALNVGTLAVWTTVASAGFVELVAGGDGKPERRITQIAISEGADGEMNIDQTPESGSPEPGPPEDSPPDAQEEENQNVDVETPPEMADIPDIPPPAEIPDMPDLPPVKQVVKAQPKAIVPSDRPKDKMVVKSAASSGSGRTASQGQTGNGSGSGNGKGTGTGNGSAPGNGKGGGDTGRLKKGSVPKPVYPSACREAGQAGRVVVSFTVDASGQVVSATVASGCPFAQLNEAALNAVKRGKFPPGEGMAKGQVPIVFNLQDP